MNCIDFPVPTGLRRKTQMKKRMGILFLVIAMLCGTLTACGTADDALETDPASADSIPADTGTESEEILSDNLPERDFGGIQTNLLITDEHITKHRADELTGDVLNDAVFNRNKQVEERFNVELNMIEQAAGWINRGQYMTAVRNAVSSGDSAYDIVAPEYYYGQEMILEGLFQDLVQMEYIDLSMPWWTPGYNDNAMIAGKLYGAVGSFSLAQLYKISVLYFQKELSAALNLPDLYEIVRQGEWIFDSFYTYASMGALDKNGDGTIALEQDQLGYLLVPHGCRSFTTNFDIPYIVREGDVYEIVFYSEKMLSVFETITSMVNKTEFASLCADYTEMETVFQEGRALFMTDMLGNAAALREMEGGFGILPMPKYDLQQAEYHSQPTGTELFAIPVTVSDPERVSILLEALNAETYFTVVPDYYEVSLKGKTARDEESGEMMDIIIDGLYYDFAFINGSNMEYIADQFGNEIVNGADDFASHWASKVSVYETKLGEMLEKYKALQ